MLERLERSAALRWLVYAIVSAGGFATLALDDVVGGHWVSTAYVAMFGVLVALVPVHGRRRGSPSG